jgi:hypothetical protein
MGPSDRLIDEKRPDDATRQTIRREIEDAFVVHLRGRQHATALHGIPSEGTSPAIARRRSTLMKVGSRKFALDSSLEGNGFELPVPVRQAKLTRSCR